MNKADYVLWISNKKMTCGVIVEVLDRDVEGKPMNPMEMIRLTPPILRKFNGDDPSILKQWLLKHWPETIFEIRPSPTPCDDSLSEPMRAENNGCLL